MTDRLLTFTLKVELVYDDTWQDFCPLTLVMQTVKELVREDNFEITNVVDEPLKKG